ncbi:MAG: phosphatase PAP2 family protein [Candidatus Syntrophosphaera sp.]|nr:phosphatase PAP2 family protein [Candidatus Syntrophosphaera sp.]
MNGLRPWLSPIDKITLAFCGWMLLYMLVGIILGRAESPEFYYPSYLSIFTGVLLLAWLERSLGAAMKPGLLKALQFARGIYPVALFGFFYTSLHSVSLIAFQDWLDPWFMSIDHKLFGYYPSLVWGQRYDTPFMQELFHFAYFCYYPMIGGLPVYFWFKNRKAFGELIFNLTFVFYACYFFYSLIPVVGGRYFPEAYQLAHAYRHGPFTHIMAFIYNHSGHWGGAFPSSHIAITLVLTIAALKYARKLGYLFVMISFFLSLATVFCHYHWFIDAVAGIFAGVLGYFAADWVRTKLQREKL